MDLDALPGGTIEACTELGSATVAVPALDRAGMAALLFLIAAMGLIKLRR